MNFFRFLFGLAKKDVTKKFTYGYQTHPFDEGNARFTVRATSLEEADRLADVRFAELVEAKCTVMREYYLITD